MRAFVAVELDAVMQSALGEMLDSLRPTCAAVKWVEAANLHLTLKFLGHVPNEKVETAIGIMKKCAADLGAFQLAVAGVGAFPHLRRPRVFFVAAADNPPTLRELAQRLNREMTRAGVRREERPFRSHVTIGRVRRPGPMHALADQIETYADRAFGRMTVNRLAFMQSELTSSGPVYSRVAEAALGNESGEPPAPQ